MHLTHTGLRRGAYLNSVPINLSHLAPPSSLVTNNRFVIHLTVFVNLTVTTERRCAKVAFEDVPKIVRCVNSHVSVLPLAPTTSCFSSSHVSLVVFSLELHMRTIGVYVSFR
eukprot:GHVN01011573.1.p1 GENE.GHVN01011573.1~~GHVN01011573.1.p1  ORF type:complete len:112 (-),score=12.02 GHVN01011573.1:760-1095(-)